MPKLLKFFLPLVVLGLGIAVFQYLKATRPKPPTAQLQEKSWRVQVKTAALQDLAPQLRLYGQVESPDLWTVSAPSAARVAAVQVREGQRVAAGSPLIQLDERDFLPRLHQAQAQVAELQAQIQSEQTRHENDVRLLEEERRLLELTQHGVDRARRLRKQRVGSASDLDQAEESLVRQTLSVRNRERDIADHPARLQALEAKLRRAQASLAEAERDWERAQIRAPFDGLIESVQVSAGDQVGKNGVLLRLYAPKNLEVRAKIPAPYQQEILQALAQGTVLEARDASGSLALSLDRLSGKAEPSGIDGLFRIERGYEHLRVGQLLSLRFSRPLQNQVVALPFAALHQGDRIYRVQQGRLQGLPVEILGSRWTGESESLLVRSPALQSGDAVLITPMPHAMEGLRVEILP